MIKKINNFLAGIMPYIADRATTKGAPFQIPEQLRDLPLAAKKEAIFAMRRRSEQLRRERLDDPRAAQKKAGQAKALIALADLVEASIINMHGRIEDHDDRYRPEDYDYRPRSSRSRKRRRRDDYDDYDEEEDDYDDYDDYDDEDDDYIDV